MKIASVLAHCVIALGMVGCAKLAIATGAHKSETKRTETYKEIGSTKLTLDIYEDPKFKENKLKPAIVFFFGGGWSSGSTKQFEEQSRYFASRGMVAIAADYRVRSRNNSRVVDSVSDARSAVRWVRANAKRLGIDPNRIAAGGGSAGGHLAASTAFIREFDDPREDKKVSAVPNALVLFNPALVLAPLAGKSLDGFKAVPNEAFLGAEASKVSPGHHVAAGGPPTIIFHGEADKTVPFETAKMFADMMVSKGNSCKLIGYPGQNHGFFNGEPWKSKTLKEADAFLVSLGWIK